MGKRGEFPPLGHGQAGRAGYYVQADVVGASVVVVSEEAGCDGVRASTGDDAVDEPVAATGGLVCLGESLAARAAPIVVHRKERADEASGGGRCLVFVLFQDDGLIWREQGARAEELTGGRAVLGVTANGCTPAVRRPASWTIRGPMAAITRSSRRTPSRASSSMSK